MQKNEKYGRAIVLLMVFSWIMVWTHAYAKLHNVGGHYFYDDTIPIYLHGAGNGFILLDSQCAIKAHDLWYTLVPMECS